MEKLCEHCTFPVDDMDEHLTTLCLVVVHGRVLVRVVVEPDDQGVRVTLPGGEVMHKTDAESAYEALRVWCEAQTHSHKNWLISIDRRGVPPPKHWEKTDKKKRRPRSTQGRALR